MPEASEPGREELERAFALFDELPPRVTRQLGFGPTDPIYQGRFTVQSGSQLSQVEGTLYFRWEPTPRVEVLGRGGLHVINLPSRRARLRVPGYGEAELLVTASSVRAGQNEFRGFVNGNLTPADAGSLEEGLRCSLTNFHEYLGDPVKVGPSSWARSRLRLETPCFVIDVDGVEDLKDRIKSARDQGTVEITHHASITATGPVDPADFSRVFDDLRYFFAFCRGYWCGPILPAPAATDPKSIEYKPWVLKRHRSGCSWFPVHHPDDVGTLFHPLRQKLASETWRDTLRNAVHWYVSANCADTVDEGLIQALIAFELLGWTTLVQESGRVSASKYKKARGDRNLARLLEYCGIPDSVPGHLSLASATANSLVADGKIDSPTGPRLIYYVRNAVIHPTVNKRVLVKSLGGKGIWEIKTLALHYLELVLLYLLGYSGPYFDRTNLGGYVGRTSTTPWSSV